jgi:hypothetical protein
LDFPRRLGIFSNEFTPSSPKTICTDIWLRRDGSQIVEKIPSLLEKAQREWLSKMSIVKIEIHLVFSGGREFIKKMFEKSNSL